MGGLDSVPNYWNIGVKLFLVNTTFKKKGHVGFFFRNIFYLLPVNRIKFLLAILK